MSERKFVEWGRMLAEAPPPEPSPEELLMLRAEVLERSESRPRVRWGWMTVTATASAVALALMVNLWPWAPQPTLAYEVGGQTWQAAQQLVAPRDDDLEVAFEDGTQMLVYRGATVRVETLDRQQPVVAVVEGTSRFAVAGGDGSKWAVRAGPYRVEVTDTTFELAWTPGSERLDLELISGTAEVYGPGLDAHATVVAGQQFSVSNRSPRQRATHTEVFAGDASVVTPASEAPVETELDRESESEARAAHRARRPSTRHAKERRKVSAPESDNATWQTAAGAGDFAQAYARARDLGWRRCIARASSAELLDLADVARLTGHASEAEDALEALRDRFPTTADAAMAAYTLGRIAADLRDRPQRAAQWFERYLAEAPNGPLAAEAMGRLIESLERAGRRDAAVAQARRYLDRFPHGAYGTAARALLARESAAQQ